MRIISKMRDVYDYAVLSVPSKDDVIYDRKEFEIQIQPHELGKHYFELLYSVLRNCSYRDSFYSILIIAGKLYLFESSDYILGTGYTKCEYVPSFKKTSYIPAVVANDFEANKAGVAAKINELTNQPVVLLKCYHMNKVITAELPCVRDYFSMLQGITSTQQIYQDIEMFLTREKPLPVTLTDEDRLIQAGFDKKTSFRGKMK